LLHGVRNDGTMRNKQQIASLRYAAFAMTVAGGMTWLDVIRRGIKTKKVILKLDDFLRGR